MSFHGNGQRRYGHVPPAQYGTSGAQDSNNANPGLQRQSSFDNGDDAAFFDPNNSRYQSGPPPTPGRVANMPQEELFLTSPTVASPGRNSFGSTSPALSGYQHQYQPFPAGSQSPPQPASYNPQAFAPQAFSRTQSQSQSQAQQYRPAPYAATNPFSSHPPYNPAIYQSTQAAPPPSRNSTVSGYNYAPSYSATSSPQIHQTQQAAPQPSRNSTVSGYNYAPSYSAASSSQVPQTPTYWSQQQQYGAPPVPARPSTQTGYEQPLQSPTYATPSSAPLPQRQSVYPPPTVSYPANGDNYSQDDYQTPIATQAPYPNYPAYSPAPASQPRPAYGEDPNSFNNRTKRSSTLSSVSAPPIPIPTGPHSAGPDGPRLERHPTLRPLPDPLADQQVGDDDDWGMSSHGRDEAVTQDQLFADIGDALGRASSTNQRNGDLLDSELGDLHRYDSRASTVGTPGVGRYASTASTLNVDRYETTDDYESDLEAAAGLEAMRIAEEQDAQRSGTGAQSFGTYDAPSSSHRQDSQDESSDSDYKNMDLGFIGGGYDAHMSYGDNLGGVNTGHSSEMEDQSRPLPLPHELNRSDSYSHTPAAGLGGMTDYSIPGEGAIHPFPAFEPARVDTFGTGGLQRPTSHSHRLSFDEGDEQSLHSRISDSRQSERSGSESPSREDMPDMFYYPGTGSFSNLNRPLPAVPPMSENRTPQLLPAGSYRNQHGYSNSYGSTEAARPMYAPSGPDAYPPQNMLSPGGQYVPRSTSLSSHSSTPQTVPPVRSKTDAEERARAQKAAHARQMGLRSGTGVDGYDLGSGTPQSTITLDLPALPAGRRKKFSPSKLSSADFRKCLEPWALSGIALWIREMAGGDTGEGESDLRQKTIEDGLIALFTHKVPTMNTADAETLSLKVVGSMFDAGILLPEEEWVKFGQGEVSGVLWQLTGSGCYSPMVHVHEIHGRCYSHHCTRTLKKINLQTQTLEPQRKSEDWVTFFKLTKESLEGKDKKEIQVQNNLHEIVMTEDSYMDQINVLRILYRDDLSTWQPPIIAKAKISKFIASVFGKIEAIKDVNENYLLAQLKYRQKEQGPWVKGFSDLFREWIRKARAPYIEYAAGFPYATYLVRREADKNILFRQFLNQAQENKLSLRLDWNTFLKAPITRLQRYSLLLSTVLSNTNEKYTEERANLTIAIDEIKAVTIECDIKVDEQTKKVEMIELQSKLFLRPGMERVELNLDHLGRELLFKGDLQRAGANRFTWLDTHAILFDHYFVLAKTVAQRDSAPGRKKEVYDVSKLPIPMQLLVLESTNDDPVVKRDVKGIGAVTTVTKTAPTSAAEARLQRTATNGIERSNTLEHTNSNNSVSTVSSVTRLNPSSENDVRSMFPFRVKHLGKSETYTLYAPTAANRQDWCEKILEAKTRHAQSLLEQNAEPFRLRVIADSAFASEVSPASRSVVSVKGTPLERSIREMEKTYAGPRPSPICRAQVNCATAFNCYGKSMIAIGTDYGVYITETSDPRGWTRAIQVARVTQIAVLEEFSLCLIIADKSLIAYHLDVIVPVSNFPAPHHDSARRAPQKLSGTRDVSFFATARMKERTLVFYKKREGLHSTFKVLEPVFQKSSEKKSRLFGKKFGGGGVTEFFREFDEFYIPTECFTINLFHSYIAISTLKGFELMTLDKKVPMSIPDLKNPAIGNIAARITGQKPLGMFRLSEAELLCCYEECGVYIDKHGDISRSVIMEFVGKAKTAAMYGAYLVLFDTDFVEVRNAENGRLRQVIAGRDVRCLDYGINPLGAGAASSHMSPSGLGNGADKRMLKLAMAHPEKAGFQIVLEMVLNEGHSE